MKVVAVGRERVCKIKGLDDAITIDEAQKPLKKTKGGKGVGMDGCHAECTKRGDVSMVEWLVRMFNICFVASTVPRYWMNGCIVPLYQRKGNKQELVNNRCINLLSTVGTVCGRVLVNSIKRGIEMPVCDGEG